MVFSRSLYSSFARARSNQSAALALPMSMGTQQLASVLLLSLLCVCLFVRSLLGPRGSVSLSLSLPAHTETELLFSFFNIFRTQRAQSVNNENLYLVLTGIPSQMSPSTSALVADSYPSPFSLFISVCRSRRVNKQKRGRARARLPKPTLHVPYPPQPRPLGITTRSVRSWQQRSTKPKLEREHASRGRR